MLAAAGPFLVDHGADEAVAEQRDLFSQVFVHELMRGRPHGVHRAAFYTAPALHPQRLNLLTEVARDVAVAPKAQPAAPWASARTRPRVEFPLANHDGDIYRQREYQVAHT